MASKLPGLTPRPWAETVMLVDAMGWLDPRGETERYELEQLVARRLAEFGA